MAGHDSQLMIDIRKLALFNKMAKEGGTTVANHLEQMTGMATEMEITKINFIGLPDIRAHVGDDEQIGISVDLLETPHGTVLFLMNAASAKRLAQATLGDMAGAEPDASGFSDMERSTIQEIGNIMTSGFIDGWANVLETTIDMSTPTFTYGPSSGMIDELVGSGEEMALMFDSKVRAHEADVDVTVYTFPELDELVELMEQIDLDE